MEENLYSSRYEKVSEISLSKKLKGDITLLRKFLSTEVRVLGSAPDYIALAFELPVNLPFRGTVAPILEKEPVFLTCHKQFYPYQCPSAYSDRKDFPSSQLPHLNPLSKGDPANFCLHRGTTADWFAEHGIIDLVLRVASWLEDAAAGNLIRPDDEFEYTRIVDPVGFMVFDERTMLDEIGDRYSTNSGSFGFDFNLLSLISDAELDPSIGKKGISFKHRFFINYDRISELIKKVRDLNDRCEKHSLKLKSTPGIVIYPAKNKVYPNYFSSIPEKLDELLEWTESLDLPLRNSLNEFLGNKMNVLKSIPVCIAIRRPTKILNHLSDIELISLVLYKDEGHITTDHKDTVETKVMLLDHRKPLTFALSREISGLQDEKDVEPMLVLGNGALGSKIAMHLIRSGHNNITFLDDDDLSPHNLVRHALLSDSVGSNKAEELKTIAEKLYIDDPTSKYEAISESALPLLINKSVDLANFRHLVDSSASSAVFNLILESPFPEGLTYNRFELSDSGNLGIAYLEGKNRNPRIDDLQAYLFDMSLEDQHLSEWLKREAKEREGLSTLREDIMIGMNCNSDTMRLPDDIISFHGATMSTFFRRMTSTDKRPGTIQLSIYNLKDPTTIASVKSIEVNPFTLLNVSNHPTWSIRMKSGVNQRIHDLRLTDMPNETGGLLLGQINLKRKVVHITGVTEAPPDSKKLPYLFVRGKAGVPSFVRSIRNSTGNQIDFVGEWHSHTGNSAKMSDKDKDAVSKLREYLDPIPYPTLILIAVEKKIKAYIFGPKHIIDL